MGADRRPKNPVQIAVWWVKKQPPKIKAFLGVCIGIAALIFLRFMVVDHDNLFVAAEAIHAIGIGVLVYKLTREKNCAGLSLKSQELTAIFLAVRLYCSMMMEKDIHTLLDLATLVTTAWVIYTMRFQLRSTLSEDLDNLAHVYILAPCAVLALLVHPRTSHFIVNRVLWAFCVYLEAVSVLPQLRVMQNAKLVEPFTAHYVFALGIARFLSCAHWILQVMDGHSFIMTTIGYGMWPAMVLLSEIVQTFILADFCYYYVRSVMEGQLMVRLPTGVVCTISVPASVRLGELKQRVGEATGLPADDRLTLIVRGTVLAGDSACTSSSEPSDRAKRLDGDDASVNSRQDDSMPDAATLDLRDDDVILATVRPRAPPPQVANARVGEVEEEEEELFDIPASASPLQRQIFLFLRDKCQIPGFLLVPFFWLSPSKWLLVILWFIAAPLLQIYFELGPLFVLGTCFALIFFNLGTRQQGEASAYSIFNEGFRELPGTLNAQRLDEHIRAGQF
ncbi:unnamed protein product [Closterium sp. Yama58-4]|nr:unnamed protein product [Closterium sp. Yama58-4]